MNVGNLISSVSEETGIGKRETKKIVDAVFATIKTKVDAGERVVIAGLGSFSMKEREAGTRVNSKTGVSREVQASRTMAFKAAGAGSNRSKGKKSAKAEVVDNVVDVKVTKD